MTTGKNLIFTNEKCVGCNKCINVCSAMGACISTEADEKGHSRINVDPERCVACGACFTACEHDAREYTDDTADPLYPVSINYSINQLSDDGYVDYLETLLQQYNIDPKYVEIEITESVILEKKCQTNTLFQRLKEHGDDVIRLVHDLNKEMTIEGVEEKWQYLRLKKFGADTIQGYYFSKPLMPEDAIRFTPSAEKPQ